MEKFCQSCVMPLNEDNLGTELDGSKSDKYCFYCYKDGKFTNPDMTFDEMLDISVKALQHQKMNPIKKWLLIKSYKPMLKKASRWNGKI